MGDQHISGKITKVSFRFVVLQIFDSLQGIATDLIFTVRQDHCRASGFIFHGHHGQCFVLRLRNVEFLLETQQIIIFRENFSVKHAEHTVRHAVDLGQQEKQNIFIGAVGLKLQCASWHIGIEPDLTAAEKFQPYGIDQNLFQPCRFRFDLCIALKGNIVCGHDTGTHFFYRYSAGAFSELIVPFLRPHSIPHFGFCGLFQGKGQRFRSDAAIRFP